MALSPPPPSDCINGSNKLRGPVLTIDIWWFITKVFEDGHDFGSLFLCARLSRDVATLALPRLYGMHEQSLAINGDTLDDEAAFEISVSLWRSIIASSLGKTLYPYCCWIKALKLGNLESYLEDLERGSNATLKAKFFSPPLDQFLIKSGKTRNKKLNRDAIIIKVSDSITDYIANAANQAGKHITLSTLEASHLPTANLQSWVYKLNRLASLVVQDGSVLTGAVAAIIRDNCPGFKELECYFCKGSEADETLAAFFSSLKRNSLESFTIRSRNHLGPKTFKAINANHSGSLKRLTLQDLDRDRLPSLPAFGNCIGLEKLILEGGWGATTLQWEEHSLEAMTEWLTKCTSLTDLEFTFIARTTEILSQALRSPSIRLKSLSLRLVDQTREFYEVLASQTNLRQLTLRILDDAILEATDERRDLFVDALCNMKHLKELDTNELFTSADIEKISRSTQELEELALTGDVILDDFILELSGLKHLKTLSIFGQSYITPDGLRDLIMQFEAHKVKDSSLHDGLGIWIANQMSEVPFHTSDEAELTARVRNSFGGKFDVTYRRELEELEESDFSD